jgi:hypothetical protein
VPPSLAIDRSLQPVVATRHDRSALDCRSIRFLSGDDHGLDTPARQLASACANEGVCGKSGI